MFGQPTQHSDPTPETPHSRVRTILKFAWLLILPAAIYSGWILLSRWDEDRIMQREAEQRQLEADRRTVEALGGDRFEILHFYASPAVVSRGGRVQLCYGASNAKAVRLDPPAGSVWPSLGRCLYAQPEQDTTYTLTIENASGETKSESLNILVR